MRISTVRLALAVALMATFAAGCATDQGAVARRGVEVTRFHLGDPIARGEIAIEPAERDAAGSLEFAQLATPIARELTRLGWRVTRASASEQVATVRVTQERREGRARRSGLTIGIGGATGGWHSGVGVGASGTIPVGGARSGDIVVTTLAVRLQRRSDATAIWEGRAAMEAQAGAPLAFEGAAVDRLATALFQDFPGVSGQTITVR